MDLFYDVGFIPIMLDLFQLCWIYSNYVCSCFFKEKSLNPKLS